MNALRTARKVASLLLGALVLAAAIERLPQTRLATERIAATTWPYLPGSNLLLRVDGMAQPYYAAVLGPGHLSDEGIYRIPKMPAHGQALLVAANASGLAMTTLRLATPPPANRPLLVVASYDDGIVFHDARTFSVLGVLATAGAPSDAAVDRTGRVAATDTQGSTLTVARLSPWSVSRVDGVQLGDEVAIDAATGAIFVTDRGADGHGALTRVTKRGEIARVATGDTAEGLAIDERRQIVYVANVNDGTVAAVDARSMRVLRRFSAAPRVFSLALSSDGTRLYAISNQSVGSLFGAPGSAVTIALDGRAPHVVARSAPLAFPIGVALDPATKTLFVTDEALDSVYVLDAATLRAKHAPIPTCRTPWKPFADDRKPRLYIPCAGADRIDVLDTTTLRRMAGAPFVTGGYPLAVAAWHPT